MRIAIAGFMHESNTFAPTLTHLRHFQESNYDFGAELLPVWEAAHHEVGGFIAGCRDWGFELVPVLMASATPGGPLTHECYEAVLRDLLKGLQQAQPFDGLLLALHGAMVAEKFPSADGETLRRIRELLGPEVPIVVDLDLHGNVSEPMVKNATAIVAYQTYPHVDQRARGQECAQILRRILESGMKPVMVSRKLPMLLHIVQQYSGSGPFGEIMDEVRRLALEPGILSCSFLPGYIYADVPCMGPTALVIAEKDSVIAELNLKRLADFAWERRHRLNATLPTITDAIDQALASERGPVCLMDCGDNIGAGSPGDSTLIYGPLVERGIKDVLVVLHDPAGVEQCTQVGVRGEINLAVGGKSAGHGNPVPVSGTVRLLHDGRFIEPEPRHGGKRFYDQGLTAVIDTADGHTIVLNTFREAPMSLHQILSLGIDPQRYKIIIVKGVTAPRAAYEPIASAIIAVDSPGASQAGPESFVYHHRPRPLFPLEPIENY